MKIDAHQHFWIYSKDEYGWMSDDMAVLRKDFLPEELANRLQLSDFRGSVAVQARQTLSETRWLLELADTYPLIKGVVGWIDLQSKDLENQLAQFVAHDKFVGVRHVVQDEPDERFILREKFLRGVEKLLDYNLTYDILIFPKQLPAAIEFVKNFPEHRFVIDHSAKPFIKDGILSPWDDQMSQIAALPNVYCKISGIVTEADWHKWQVTDFQPYIDVIIKSFGSQRIMFGSDWPVCTVAASYKEVVDIVETCLSKHNLSEQENSAVWGGNAVNFYGLNID